MARKKEPKAVKASVKVPGKRFEVKMLEDDLGVYQSLVGGYIEAVGIGKGVLALCDEDGKFKGLQYNFPIWNGDHIVGTAVLVGRDGEGNFASLTEEQCDYAEEFVEGFIDVGI